jgi:hypothetical protein
MRPTPAVEPLGRLGRLITTNHCTWFKDQDYTNDDTEPKAKSAPTDCWACTNFYYPSISRLARLPPKAFNVLVPGMLLPACAIPFGIKYSSPTLIGICFPSIITVYCP